MIRRASHADVAAILDLAERRYPAFDRDGAELWLSQAIDNVDMMVLRSEHGVLVATAQRAFWGGPLLAHLLFLVTEKPQGLSRAMFREALSLMRVADHWRQTLGAKDFHFGAESEADFSLLARALGADEARPTYRLGPTAMSEARALARTPAPRRGSAIEQALGRVFA